MAPSMNDVLIAQRLTKVETELSTLAVNVNRLINSQTRDRRFWRWAVGAICLALTGGAAVMPKGGGASAEDIARAIRSTQHPADQNFVKAWEDFLRERSGR